MGAERGLVTRSAAATARVGRELARHLRAGDVVGLAGALGCGKTTLAQGIVAGLGATEPAVSPSFVLIREYRGRVPVVHLDLYRLETERELERIGVPDYLGGEGVALVEWCERLGEMAPVSWLVVTLEEGAAPSERRLAFRAVGETWPARLEAAWPALAGAAEEKTI